MVKPHVAAVTLAIVFTADPAGAQTPAAPPPPYACTAPAHRAFDFWLGGWDVFVTGTDNLAGKSRIEKRDGGCVITEQWENVPGPFSGRSLNAFDVTTGRWTQVWMDSVGEITRFEGGPTATGMQFLAPGERRPGRADPADLRMTFTRNPDGSVRQTGERRGPDGAWTTTYDYTYRLRTGD